MTRARFALVLVALALAATEAPRAAEPKARDLSGVWAVRLTGRLTGPSLLCRAVPDLNTSWRDTVLSARSLEELLYAVVPDSARAWFDEVCDPAFAGDSVRARCRVPLSYARPCFLIADLTFRGALRDPDLVTGQGGGDVSLGGPGLCPQSSCPGVVEFVATRLGPVPPGARRAAPAR